MNRYKLADDFRLLDSEGRWRPREDSLENEMVALAERCCQYELGPYRTMLMLSKLRSACNPPSGEGNMAKAVACAMRAASALDWDDSRFAIELLQQELLDLANKSVESPEVHFYVKEREQCDELLAAADRGKAQLHQSLYQRFLELNEQLGTVLLHREDALVRRSAVEQSFMRLYGDAWLAQAQAALRLRSAEIRRELLDAEPGLTREEVDARVAERLAPDISAFEAALECLRLASVEPIRIEPGDPTDIETLKKLLKAVHHILHPDRHVDLPLTEAQRTELADLWCRSQSIDRRSLPQSGTLVSRSLDLLRACLERGRAILRMAGIDIDPALVVQGDTLEDRIVYMQLSIPRLEQRLHMVFEELRSWRDDLEHRWRQTLVEYPEQARETERARMQEKARELEQLARQLEE